MWCEHCRQNVAGMVSQTQDSVCCSQCGCALPEDVPDCSTPLPCPSSIAVDSAPVAYAPGSPGSASPALPRPALDNWDIDEDLRHIERLLRRDRPRAETPLWHLGPTDATPPPSATTPTSTGANASSWFRSLQAGLAWLFLCVGLAATVCGLMLLAWHWFGHRPELLIPGLACAAAGQFCLLGGFLIQPAAISAAGPKPPPDAAHPAGQWLEVHRRIDEILRADLPGRRKPE